MWNVEKRLQGWLDSPLTESGLSSAGLLAERLKDIEFDKIYASDQKRAVETAKILRGDRNTEIISLEDLRELGFGKWEGMTLQEIQSAYPEEYNTYKQSPDRYQSVGGENLEMLFQRIGRAIDNITSGDHSDVLVVSHGVAIRAIISTIMKLPIERFGEIPVYPGTSLTIIEGEGRDLKILKMADIEHNRRLQSMFRSMRRKDRETTPEKAIEILERAEHGVLSINGDGGYPYGVAMSHVVLDEKLYFHCAPKGQKLDMIVKNQLVSYSAVASSKTLPEEFATDYESAIVFGKASIVEGEEKLKALEGLIKKYSPDHLDKGMQYIGKDKDKTVVIRVDIDHITGKIR